LSRSKDKSSLGILLLLVLIIIGGVYLYSSKMFERNPPVISLDVNGYWNLKKPLKLKIKDDSGIKEYKVILKSSSGSITLKNEKLMIPKKSLSLEIKPPRSAYAMKDKKITIFIQARDSSKWNFFSGNFSDKKYNLIIDKKRPDVSVVNNSYKISRGGSALVIFRALDDNMKDIYIESNFKKRFKVEPFYKDGYYIALLAWPVQKSSFRATVVATDAAGNIAKSYIPLYLKNRKYMLSKIRIKDKFLKGKIADLSEEFEETQGVTNPLKRFKIINEDVRAKDEKLIQKITSVVPTTMINNFKMRPMYPLKNAAVVAHFGDHRKYYYRGKFISEAYHLGIDLASESMAVIKSKNRAKVVFAGDNGIYGNMLALSYGLGLYTIYGHTSSFNVGVGDIVSPNSKIANTGKTGYAMGDHLHFGVLVQGIEVRPQEWMDKTWIKLNISDIIKSAKKTINRN